MRNDWTRSAFMRRIDRCYLIAAWTSLLEKRTRYLELARSYRLRLAHIPLTPAPTPA